MSPEQASGKELDARSDIFSFGTVLFEALCGQRPFRAKSNLELLQAITEQPAPPIGGLLPDLPMALQNVVDKALEKDPADRYQTMRDMVVDLRRVLRDKQEGSAIRDAGVSRWRAWAMTGLLVIALGSSALAAYLWSRGSGDNWVNPLRDAQFTRLTDNDGSEMDAALSPDGKFVAFLAVHAGPVDAFIGQVGLGLFTNASKGWFPELYHENSRSIGFTADGSELWMRSSPPDPVRPVSEARANGVWTMPAMGGTPRRMLDRALSVTWAGDGARMAYFEPTSGDPIYLAGKRGANPRKVFEGRPGEHCHYPYLTRDGKFIYFVRGFRVTETDIWRIATGADGAAQTAERLTYHNAFVAYPVPLDDNTLLYIGPKSDGSGKCLYALDLKSRITRRANLGVEDIISISASDGPNGPMSRLVVSVANPRGLLWQAPILTDRVAAEKDLTRVQLPAVRAVSPRFGPGYLLYQSSKGGSDGLWKLQDREAVEIWRPSDAFLAAPAAVSPDGKRLCLTLRQGERHSLHLLSAEGTGMRAIAESLNVVDTASWSPDGRFLTVAANNDGLGGRVYRVPVDPADGLPEKLTDDHAYNPVWSPDGGMILYYHSEQSATFRLKAVSPGKRGLPIPEVKVRGEGGRFRFMPGGKAFVALLGPFRDQNFYLVDLVSGTKRQLTQMTSGSSIRNFDISPDGRRIIFDRIEENSDVVLIDLAPRTSAVSPRP